MVEYRRNRLPGGTYFFTVTLRDRHSSLLIDHINLLRLAFRKVQSSRKFEIDAIVVLPDHLHTIWTLPTGDEDYPKRWQSIKSSFTRALVKSGVPLIKNNKGEYSCWQRRYWEHTIRNDSDFEAHISYMHYNPVKHGLVKRVQDWPYSSFHTYVRSGRLEADWAAEPGIVDSHSFGE